MGKTGGMVFIDSMHLKLRLWSKREDCLDIYSATVKERPWTGGKDTGVLFWFYL